MTVSIDQVKILIINLFKNKTI